MTNTEAVTQLADRLEVLLNETEEELGRPLDDAEVQSVSNEFLSALDEDEEEVSHPDVTTANASHFATCKRDDKGHCLPGEGGGSGGKADKDAPIELGKDAIIKDEIPKEKVGAVQSVAKGFRNTLAAIGANFGLQQGAMIVAGRLLGAWGSAAVFLGSQQALDKKTLEDAEAETDRKLRDLERSRKSRTNNAAPPIDETVEAILDFIKKVSHAAGKDPPSVAEDEVRKALEKQMAQGEASHPDEATENASYFATCKRDEKGHCLPGEGGGKTTAKDEGGSGDAGKDEGDWYAKKGGGKEKVASAAKGAYGALVDVIKQPFGTAAVLSVQQAVNGFLPPLARAALATVLGSAFVDSTRSEKSAEDEEEKPRKPRSKRKGEVSNAAAPADELVDEAMKFLRKLCEASGEEMPEVSREEMAKAIAEESNKGQANNEETFPMTRNDTVAWLVANCDCFKNKGRVLANEDAFSDDDLDRLKATTEADKKRERALNAVQQTTGVDLIANASDDDMMAKCKELMGKEETAEGEATANRRVLSDNEWLATAPPRIRTVVQNALAQQEAERQNLMAQLRDIAANTASPTRKSIIESRLRGNPAVESLRDMMALVQPEATHNAQAFGLGYPSYAGAAPSPHSPYALTDNEAADVLDLEAIRAEQDAREQQKRAN